MAQEHLLIQGGEQWLPFARSRIKAMRATAVIHASQKFEIDGSLVRVRVEPGHDYIQIVGGDSDWLNMDTGVIDLQTVFPRNILRFQAGVFKDTTATYSYKAPFLLVKGDFKYNDGGASNAQLAGDIRGKDKGIVGRVPVDPQPPTSFAPLKSKNDDGSVSYAREDINLAAKKLSAAVYPASCFTGRMRAYVQAMQGQPLYKPGSTDGQATITAASWNGVVPGVTIPYANEPFLDGLPRRTVDSNCSSGVIKTRGGRYWLANIGGSTVWFFPLRASSSAKKLRKYLSNNSAVLSDAAKDKLECYILASSRPVASKMITVPLGAKYEGLSMGYGWHWNWSGTKANIVVSSEYDQKVTVSGHPGMGLRSQHFQMGVTPTYGENDLVTGWVVDVADVEGTKYWGVDRQVWCIAYPNWGSPYLDLIPFQEKLFPRWSKLTDTTTDVPFYVFYNKDELVLCRVKISKRTGVTDYAGTHLNTYGPGTPFTLTEGDRGGFRRYVTSGTYHEATFSVGANDFSARPYGYSGSGLQEVTSGVSTISPEPAGWGVFVYSPPYHDFTVGYPSSYKIVRRVTPVPGTSLISNIGGHEIALTFTTSNLSQSYNGKTDILIPFNDAEAIYVSNKVIRQSFLTGQVQSARKSTKHGQWATWWSPIPPGSLVDAPHENFLRYMYASSGGETIVSSGAIPDSIEVSTETDEQILFSRGAQYPVVISDAALAQCQTPAISASTVIFPAQSGVSTQDPVVISMFLPDGHVGVKEPGTIDTPAIVGWA